MSSVPDKNETGPPLLEGWARDRCILWEKLPGAHRGVNAISRRSDPRWHEQISVMENTPDLLDPALGRRPERRSRRPAMETKQVERGFYTGHAHTAHDLLMDRCNTRLKRRRIVIAALCVRRRDLRGLR